MAEEADKRDSRYGNGKIHNAEEFGNYVHAVTVPMKIMMAAIVVFFAGAIAYCVFGSAPVTASCVAVSQEGCICYVKDSDRNGIEANDEVEINGTIYMISGISSDAIVVDESINAYTRELGNLSLGDSVFTATVDGDVPQGVYQATIIKDYLNPIRVLLNV